MENARIIEINQSDSFGKVSLIDR